MNHTKIKESLKNYDDDMVSIFLAYVTELETAKNNDGSNKNAWMRYVTEPQLIGLFIEVAKDDGMFIDGKTITIQYKGKLMVSYNFQAYKNKLLLKYPDTTFDLQLVNEGDTFKFEKQSGRVIYSHKMTDPFALNKEIIGAYCVIKNKRGEFIETLNQDEIKKMRNVAKTQKIWDLWTGEMIIKSIMKRSCKRHFNDLVVNIEILDNENYDLEQVNVDHQIQLEVENAHSLAELETIYSQNIDFVEDEVQFLAVLKKRKVELKSIAS